MTTPVWRIAEKPGYSVERTAGAWVLWGPCRKDPCVGEDCPECGGEGESVLEACGLNADGAAADPDMVSRALGITDWTPIRE